METHRIFLKKKLKLFFLLLFRIFVHSLRPVLLPNPRGKIHPEKVNRILIYGHMGIGNMILFLPVLRAYRNHFKESTIDLLVGDSGAEMVIEDDSIVDEVVRCKIEDLPLIETLGFILKMRRRKYDLILSNFNGSRHSLALLTLASGAPYRIGHISNREWKNIYDHLYNYKIKMGEGLPELENNLKLVEGMGFEVVDRRPSFRILEEDRQFATQYFRRHHIRDEDIVIGIQMGTSPEMTWKQWDARKYVDLTAQLMKKRHMKVIVLGSSKERKCILQAFVGSRKIPIIAAGELTLKQTAAVIEKVNMLICNDSGLMHVGAAVNTPVIAIYGPTDVTRTAPIGKNHSILRKNLPCSPCFTLRGDEKVRACEKRICLDLIRVEDVLQEVEKRLNRNQCV